MKLEGGCLCGKVRYSGEAEPIFVGVCHCSTCQKAREQRSTLSSRCQSRRSA